MVTFAPQNVNFYLSEISEKDKNWDSHKTYSARLSNIFSVKQEFAKRGYEMNRCAEYLMYHATDNPERPLKLASADFCRDRGCPTCQWRRSLRWAATLHEQIPPITLDYPTHRWVFLTLTVRNCDIGDLRKTISSMNKGFTALVRTLKKRFPTVGYIKTIEVTRAKDDTAHPHFHVMLCVPASYFSHGYIKQSEWVELWQKSAKLPYAPNVDIRAIKPQKSGKSKGSDKGLAGAIAETMKYAVKPDDLVKVGKDGTYEWTYEYFRQVKNMRFVAIGGILKGRIKAEWRTDDQDDDDLVHVGGGDDEQGENTEAVKIIFNFNRFLWRYVC